MENNICNSMILTSRRRHFYLVGKSKHKVGACGVNNQASAVLAGNELPFVAFSPDGRGYELVSSVRALVPQKLSVEEELMHVKHVDVKSPHVVVMWKFGRRVISSGCGIEFSLSLEHCIQLDHYYYVRKDVVMVPRSTSGVLTEDNDLPSTMEFLKNRKVFFKDLRLDTALNEMLCDAREFPDEIDIPANFELTQTRHRVR
ncbi:hypothetical protein TNCV_700131 [Trichonephila clavipes]|nr:hypothetical protein TNCV_700131 [Trichonephila clavipes]